MTYYLYCTSTPPYYNGIANSSPPILRPFSTNPTTKQLEVLPSHISKHSPFYLCATATMTPVSRHPDDRKQDYSLLLNGSDGNAEDLTLHEASECMGHSEIRLWRQRFYPLLLLVIASFLTLLLTGSTLVLHQLACSSSCSCPEMAPGVSIPHCKPLSSPYSTPYLGKP